MPECHNCKHFQDPRLIGLPWKNTPCSTCRLADDPSHKGQSHVSRDSSDAVAAEEAMQPYPDADRTDYRIERLAGFLKQFMTLPACTRDIVAHRFVYPDRPLSDIARRYGITVQATHSRLKKALDRFPVLREVITMRERGEK